MLLRSFLFICPHFIFHPFSLTFSSSQFPFSSRPPSPRRLTYFSRCVSLVKSPEQQLRACCIARHHPVRFCFGLLQFTNEFFAFLVLSVFFFQPLPVLSLSSSLLISPLKCFYLTKHGVNLPQFAQRSLIAGL